MANTVTCSYQSLSNKGNLIVNEAKRFMWKPIGENTVSGALPEGDVRNVASITQSKVAPGKPIAMKITMNDKSSFVLTFDSVEARQRARNLLESTSNSGGGADARTSPVPMMQRESPVPSVTSTPIPQITITTSAPVSFNQNLAHNLSEEDLEARASLLRKDPELRSTHAKLVLGGLLSDDDFWAGKEAKVQEERLLLRQKRGLLPEALIDPTPGGGVLTGPAQEVEMTMTAEMIERVFREHPDVLRKYKTYVPNQMTEKQFWTAYLHCKYVLGTKRNVDQFGETKGGTRKRNQRAEEEQRRAAEIFGDVNEYRMNYRENLESDFNKRIKNIDSSIDLRVTADDSLTISPISGLAHSTVGGYGLANRNQSDLIVVKSEKELARSLRASAKVVDKETSERISKAVKDDPILTKINERASLALTPEDERVLAESEALRRARLKEDHEAELYLDRDLVSNPAPSVVELKLASYASSQASTITTTTTTTTTSTNLNEAPRPKPTKIALEPANSLPNPNAFFESAPSSDADARLLKLDPTLKSLPLEIREAYLVAAAALDEYCRHYWSSPSDSDMKKRCLIVQKMKEVKKQVDIDLRAAMRHAASDALPLLRLPLAQIGRCFDDHDKRCKLSHA